MRFTLSTRAVAGYHRAAASLLLLAAIPAAQAQDTEILSNATIVQMVTGKLSKDLIVGKINAARPGFDLSSDGIISLHTSKVDQNIIKLMLQVAESARRKGDPPPGLTGLDEVLSNDVVVRMVTGKVPKQIILAKMQISRSAYDVTASGLVSLSASKVPEDVIKAMMMPPPPPANPTPIPIREAPAAAAPVTAPAPPAAKPATGTTKAKPPATKAPVKTPPPTPPPKKPPQL